MQTQRRPPIRARTTIPAVDRVQQDPEQIKAKISDIQNEIDILKQQTEEENEKTASLQKTIAQLNSTFQANIKKLRELTGKTPEQISITLVGMFIELNELLEQLNSPLQRDSYLQDDESVLDLKARIEELESQIKAKNAEKTQKTVLSGKVQFLRKKYSELSEFAKLERDVYQENQNEKEKELQNAIDTLSTELRNAKAELENVDNGDDINFIFDEIQALQNDNVNQKYYQLKAQEAELEAKIELERSRSRSLEVELSILKQLVQ